MADSTNPPSEPSAAQPSTPAAPPSASTPQPADVSMADADGAQPAQNPSPANNATSPAAPKEPSPAPEVPKGNIREYLNRNVTPHLTAGCKLLVKDTNNLPEDPLRIIGEYLLERHNEMVKQKNQDPQGNAADPVNGKPEI